MKAAVLSVVGIVAILSFTSALTQSQQSSVVQGVADTPRSFVGTLTPETRLYFGGWVNFSASQGQIQVDVLRFPNDVGTLAQTELSVDD